VNGSCSSFLPRLLNFIWFFNEIRKSDCNPQIRKSLPALFGFLTSFLVVLISGLGAVIWAVGIAIWASSFEVWHTF
jgi:hypothetical protein